MAVKKGRGLLMVYADIPVVLEDEFNRWYNEEHLPELLAIPGVLNAGRYEAVRGGPKHLACYELAEPEVCLTEDWQQRLANPSAWAARMSPKKIGTRYVRNVYRLIYPENVPAEIAQADMAPALLIGRMGVPESMDAAFNSAYNNERLPLYRSIPDYTRARRFVAVRREPDDEPKYTTVHECLRPEVADSPEWDAVRKAPTPVWTELHSHIRFAQGSPGVYRRIFP